MFLFQRVSQSHDRAAGRCPRTDRGTVTLTQAGPSVPPKIHLLIVDQQRTFRDALAIRLRAEPDLVVAAEAQSTESALRVLAGRSTDVVLLDAELPDDSSFTFCAEVTRRLPAPCVVMLSAASEAQRIVAAVRADAVAWVRKDESIDYLLRVIRCVVRGETWLPPAELRQVLRLLIDDQDDRRGRDELLAALTPRERDVLFHLLEGAGCKDIAVRLQLSTNTVRSHLQSLTAKFGVHSTLELVALTRPRLEALPENRQLRTSTMPTGVMRSGFGPTE
jgi:DNA-binding NarL/FixJ family response regulator